MTSSRSLTASTSSRSEEITSTARPSAASASTRRWTSALAPTSMPCVGSSRISTFGRVASPRASATFCWLPPESVATRARTEAALIPSRETNDSASRSSAARSTSPSRLSSRSTPSEAFAATDISLTTPKRRRSSGTYAMPRRRASSGLRIDGRAARHPDLPRVGRRQAEDRARELGAAGSHEPGHPDDLSGAQLQAHAVDARLRAGELPQLEERRARARLAPLALSAPARVPPSGARARRGPPRRARASPRAARRAAPCSGRRAPAPPRAGARRRRSRRRTRAARARRRQVRGLVLAERGRRLVHHQDAGARAERARDLHELLLGHAQAAHERFGIDAGPEPRQAARAPPVGAAARRSASRARLSPCRARCSRPRSGRGRAPAAGRSPRCRARAPASGRRARAPCRRPGTRRNRAGARPRRRGSASTCRRRSRPGARAPRRLAARTTRRRARARRRRT